MRMAVIICTVVVSTILQSTWLASMNLPGQVKPDLVMVIVISYALLKGPYFGINLGLFAGFFVDLISGGMIGAGALTKMFAGFTAGIMEKTIFKDNLLVPFIAVFSGTIFFEILEALIRISFGANLLFFYTIWHTILPMACYNALLAPLIYHGLYKWERKLAEKANY